MNTYFVLLKDKKQGTLDTVLLEKHVEHLKHMECEGRLKLCGPFEDNESAMQILLARDQDEAARLIEADPFIAEGYYASYEVKKLYEANADNNWLMTHDQTESNLSGA